MSYMKIDNSNIVTAYNEKTIGAKIIDRLRFNMLMMHVVGTFDFASTRVPGQGVIQLPDEAIGCVSGGLGRHSGNPKHYVIRTHWTGQVQLFLQRDMALQPNSVSIVVNTRDAYLADPDVMKDAEETRRITESKATHVLVAVLSSHFDTPPPLPMATFVRNLAGANNEALVWTADEIRAKAKAIQEFHETWCVVAD